MTAFLRRHAVNLVLVGLAVVLGVVVLATWGRVTTTEKEARELNVLAAWHEDELSRIVLERKASKIVLDRKPSGDGGERSWFISQPFQEEADPAAMLELVGAFEYARWIRRIKPEEVNRAAFGLDAPERKITLEMGPVGYRLIIGKEAASPRGAHYLELSGKDVPNSGVMIISRELFQQLDVQADSLRERLLTPYLASSLRRFVLEGEGGVRKLRRAEWGGFRFDGMLGDVRVDKEGLDRVLVQLARTKAERFIDVKAAETALKGASSVTMTMQPEDPKRATGIVLIGGKCPGSEDDLIVLRKQPDALAACASRSIWQGFIVPADELVDRKVFSAALDQVEGLVIVRGEAELDMQRKGEGFVLRKPNRAEVDSAAGTQRLEGLLGASGHLIEKPDLAALGLEPPRGRVVITHLLDEGTKPKEQVVLIGAPGSDGKTHVLRKQDGAVLELSREDARLLAPDASLVRSLKILAFQPSDLHSIEVRLDGLREKLIRHPSGAYDLEQPKGFTPDGSLAGDLVDTLASLGADRWIADRDDGSFGLGQPHASVHIELEMADGGKRAHDLVIGDATSGGAFASLAGNPGVFVLPKRALEVVDTLLFDRSVLMIDPSAAPKIAIFMGERKVELEKRGTSYEPVGGADLTPARVQQIIDALSTLRVEAAVHTGPQHPNEGLSQPALRVEAGKKRFVIGAGDAWRNMSVYYARAEGSDATYVVARSKVQAILDAL
jgi:hypothetical protein